MTDKRRYVVAGGLAVAAVSIPLLARAYAKQRPLAPPPPPPPGGTMTSGIQETLDAGGSVFNIAPGLYPISAPITIRRPMTINMDPATVIKVVSQIDGGIFQVIDSGLSDVTIQGGILDGNNLSVLGVWVAKITPRWKVMNMEIKNLIGVMGLNNVGNVAGLLAQGIGGGLASNLYVHDLSTAPNCTYNGAGIWFTGNQGITQPENTVAYKCTVMRTLQIGAQGIVIHGIKHDVNTWGLTTDSCAVSDTSGDGVQVDCGGAGNVSNYHTIRNCNISNTRIGISLNAIYGGTIRNTTVDRNTVLSRYGIYEAAGADYNTLTNNNVPSGITVDLGAGLHDIRFGNIGF